MSENQVAILIGAVILALYGLNRFLRDRYRATEESRRLTLHNIAIQVPGRTFEAVGNPLFAMNMVFDEEADYLESLLRVENVIRGSVQGIEYELFDLVFLKSRFFAPGWLGEKRTGVARIMLEGHSYPKFILRPRRWFSRKHLSGELSRLDLQGHPGLQANCALYSRHFLRPVRVLTPPVVSFINRHPDVSVVGNEHQLGLYTKEPMPPSKDGLAIIEQLVIELSAAFDKRREIEEKE